MLPDELGCSQASHWCVPSGRGIEIRDYEDEVAVYCRCKGKLSVEPNLTERNSLLRNDGAIKQSIGFMGHRISITGW